MIEDILRIACQHGYSFDVAAKAIETSEDERREGIHHWLDRGPLALLEATRSMLNPVKATLRETLDAKRVRV